MKRNEAFIVQATINQPMCFIHIYAPDTGNLVIWTPFFYRSAHRCPRKEKLHENTVHVRPHASFQLPPTWHDLVKILSIPWISMVAAVVWRNREIARCFTRQTLLLPFYLQSFRIETCSKVILFSVLIYKIFMINPIQVRSLIILNHRRGRRIFFKFDAIPPFCKKSLSHFVVRSLRVRYKKRKSPWRRHWNPLKIFHR